MANPQIILLVGGQNSGKSKWVENTPGAKKVISRDKIRELYAQEKHLPYQATFAPDENTQVNALFFDELKLALADRFDPIVIDNTNMQAKDRKAILDTVDEYGYDYHRTALVFPLEVEEAMRRNSTRDSKWREAGQPERSIPEAIIRSTYEGYEPPQPSEGFDIVRTATHPSNAASKKAIHREPMLGPDGLLDPDMPAQKMRLHMGEMTAQEMRKARAAIRWANSCAKNTCLITPERVRGICS